MKLNENEKRFLRKLGNVILPRLVNVLCKSLRIKFTGANIESVQSINEGSVFAFWHGKMVVGWYLFRRNSPSALVSSSKDGDILFQLLKYWNYEVARGSSSKGGKEALEKLVEYAKAGKCVAITPDGPKGPIFKLKAGCVIAAQRANVPLYLVGIKYSSSWKLKSWDKLEIPKPFSEVIVNISEPVTIAGDLAREEVSKIISECEIKLNELNK